MYSKGQKNDFVFNYYFSIIPWVCVNFFVMGISLFFIFEEMFTFVFCMNTHTHTSLRFKFCQKNKIWLKYIATTLLSFQNKKIVKVANISSFFLGNKKHRAKKVTTIQTHDVKTKIQCQNDFCFSIFGFYFFHFEAINTNILQYNINI
jgi:hypothetical protein